MRAAAFGLCATIMPFTCRRWVAHEDGKWRDNADPDAFFKNFDDVCAPGLAVPPPHCHALSYCSLEAAVVLAASCGLLPAAFLPPHCGRLFCH